MYKHHSYNNLVEKKLAELPATDAEGLWGSMEAILDKQLPQKKRRPGFIAWLFTHKVWIVATLLVGVAGASTLVYVGGDDRPVQTPAAPTAQPGGAVTALPPKPAAATPAGSAVPGPDAAAALPPSADPSVSTTDNNHQQITYSKGVLSATAIHSTGELRSDVNHTTTPGEISANNTKVSASSNATPAGQDNQAAQSAAAAESAVAHWAATTGAITPQQATEPMIDPSAVKVNTEMLEHLSQQIAASAAAAKRMGQLPQEKGLYAGVVAGLDMSSVEFGPGKTGSNKGFIVGYAFNNRWSVESGVLWNKKHFSADGSYYKADGYIPQPGLTILEVNSTSQLYELPLNVKYNLLTGANKLFVTAGVSSYLIKRENIDLYYDWNGQQGNQYYDYSSVSKHWLSVANLSVGYALPLGGVGSLRVEPYVKLPLKELGVCNMRVTSMGLNVGFTRMLKR